MEEDKKGFLGGIMSVLGPLLPLILALVAGFFLFKKFFHHETVDEKPDAADKPNVPNSPQKSGYQILEEYADRRPGGNQNGRLDVDEKEFLKKKLGKVLHKDGSALSDIEYSFVPDQMNGTHKAEIDHILLKSLKNGKLTDEGFDSAAKEIAGVVAPQKKHATERH